MLKTRKIIFKIKQKFWGLGLLENVNKTDFNKNCLLLYITEPFLISEILTTHQNQWQVKALAKIVGEFGYNVDVIDYNDTQVKLTKLYDLVIDLHPGLNGVYYPFMAPDCKKIGYITGSNPSFSNQAELKRIEQLYRRRGTGVKQRRYVPPFSNNIMESLDAVFIIGNRQILKAYDEFKLKKVFLIKNTGYSGLGSNDFSKKSAANFLFLASGGQVHKGLDLLLEIFSRKKHLNLYICSDFSSEKDFCRVYRRELYNSPNIYPVGFIDIYGEKFRNIAEICGYMILPSCSEGMAGSVLTAMSAGLIPLISRECGYEDDEVFFFDNNSIECIAETIERFASQNSAWIEEKSDNALDIVRTRYNEDSFRESVRVGLSGVVNE